MPQPQLILTLSPAGSLQAELPGPNGARRVLPLDGHPSDILESLRRLLFAQARGSIKIGSAGFPTSQQLHHTINHSETVDGCPFCNLGLRHSNNICQSSKTTIQQTKKAKKHRLDPRTVQTLATWAPPINPDDFGI